MGKYTQPDNKANPYSPDANKEKELENIEKSVNRLYNFLRFVIIIMGLAILGQVFDSIQSSYLFRTNINKQVSDISAQIQIMGNDISNLSKQYDYINNKLDNIIIPTKK